MRPERPEPINRDTWRVEITDLRGLDEVIDTPTRTILIDPTRHGEEWMTAHAFSHIEWGHHLDPLGGRFSADQEADADWLAAVQLGLAPERPALP